MKNQLKRIAYFAIKKGANYPFFRELIVDVHHASSLVFYFKVIIFRNNIFKKMMKLAVVFLPIVFAVIWMLFIGLRINRRDENRKLINY